MRGIKRILAPVPTCSWFMVLIEKKLGKQVLAGKTVAMDIGLQAAFKN